MIKIDVTQDVTKPLVFNLDMDVNKGFALGKLAKVELAIKEAEGEWEYKGEQVATLLFRFTQNKIKQDDPDRVFVHVEKTIPSINNAGDPISNVTLTSLYTSMWRRMKHIYDAYAAFAPNVRPITQEDIDSVMVDETATAVERAAAFIKFFKYFNDLFNSGTDKKPIYLDDKGVPYDMTIKLVADYNGGDKYEFPNFTGEGFLEKTVIDNGELITNLRFSPKESIVLGTNRKDVAPTGNENMASPGGAINPELAARLGIK